MDAPPEFDDLPRPGDFECTPSVAKLGAALAKAQAMIGYASKDSNNPHFGSKYADLASVTEACRGPITEAGIAVVQFPLSHGALVGVRTMLIHQDEWMASTLWCRPIQQKPQDVGAVITYLRRFALSAVVWVAPKDDDDAEAAQGRPAPAAQTESPARKLAAEKKAKREAPPPASAKTPPAALALPTPPVAIPEGMTPIYVPRENKWTHDGFEPLLTKSRLAHIKILQKELGISEEEWRPKLGHYWGKSSSTELSEREALECISRLEKRKEIQQGSDTPAA